MAQVTYYSMLILPVLAFLWPNFQLLEKKKIKKKKIARCRPAAAGKNISPTKLIALLRSSRFQEDCYNTYLENGL